MSPTFHIHLVSDATGETINSIARAAIVQFEGVRTQEHYWSLIRHARQLDLVMDGIRQWPGLALYTFVDEDLRRSFQEFCITSGIISIDVMAPVLKAMALQFGVPFGHMPGRQHALDAGYFARIDAMDFAMAMDDGHGAHARSEADVVLIGVSRTSKTPTCLYLAGRGIKAANVPLVRGHEPPADLLQPSRPLIIGLTKDPESLAEIRRLRLPHLHEKDLHAYADPDHVRAEVLEARRFFTKIGCDVIDVTQRSIEETAAEIVMLLTNRGFARPS